MKLTTIVVSSVLTLGSTLALAQGASSDDATAAGGATGDPPGQVLPAPSRATRWTPAARGTARKVRGTRDNAQDSGSGNASATTAGGATGAPAGAGSSNAVKSETTGSSKGPAPR